MAGNDGVLAIDEDWIGPAELSDARCDLGDLGIGVRAAVGRIWDQVCD